MPKNVLLGRFGCRLLSMLFLALLFVGPVPVVAEVVHLCAPGQQTYFEAVGLWLSGSGRDGAQRLRDVHYQHHKLHHVHAEKGPGANFVKHPWSASVVYLTRYHDPRALLPLAALHIETHAMQVGVCQYQEAAETRQFLRLLFGELVKRDRGDSPEVRDLIAGMWTRMGLALRWVHRLEDAGEAFREALRYNPDDPFVLLSLSALHEKQGEYRDGAGYLDKLLRDGPRHPEARLRLALAEARLGKSRQALSKLASLSREAPEWIRVVAYQEWVQILLDLKDRAAAEEVLSEARHEFPGNPRLDVLQLYLLDDRSAGSAALLDQLATSGQGARAETPPRALYNRWPEGEMEVLRVVYTDAAAYEPLLDEALREEGCL